jgi:hypothetical protein
MPDVSLTNDQGVDSRIGSAPAGHLDSSLAGLQPWGK